ncbi:hypothetical protein D3C78_1450350 [compost metagenome]
MAVAVVDGLEPIQIDKRHQHRNPAPRPLVQQALQRLLQPTPVGQLGQRVRGGIGGQPGIGGDQVLEQLFALDMLRDQGGIFLAWDGKPWRSELAAHSVPYKAPSVRRTGVLR